MLNFNLRESRYFRNFGVVSPVGTYSAKKGVWKIKHTNYTPGEYQEEVKYKCQQTSQLAFCFVVIARLPVLQKSCICFKSVPTSHSDHLERR